MKIRPSRSPVPSRSPRRPCLPGHRSLVATAGLIALAAVGFVAACDSGPAPLDEKAVTDRAASNVQAVMHESGLALAFTVAQDGAVSRLMGSSSDTASSVVAPALSGGMPPTAMMRALVGPALTQQMTGVELAPTMLTTEEQFDEIGDELARLMRERLFVDANFESNADGTATYLLHADPTCRPLPQDSDPAGTVPAITPSCADDLAKVAVRVAVKADGDGVRMTLLIGAERLELLAVIVHGDEIAVEVDLPKARAASELLQRELGDGNPVETYTRLAGQVRASLKKVGPQKVTAGLAISRALDIASANQTLTMAASSPLIALTSDGMTKTAQLQFGVGATDLGAAWDPQGTGLANTDMHVVTAGVYGTLSLDEAAQEVVFTDLGLGATRIAVRGTTILDLQLNPDTMRRFSGKLSVTGDVSRLELTPRFDLALAFDYDAIAGDFATPPEATVGHESYALSLQNPGAPVIVEEAPRTASFAGGLKMLAGSLSLAAASVPAQTVVVPMGRCLSTTDAPVPGAHPILGTLVVSECP